MKVFLSKCYKVLTKLCLYFLLSDFLHFLDLQNMVFIRNPSIKELTIL